MSIEDENDVAPKFARKEWDLAIAEGQSTDTILASLTVLDPDLTNNFAYEVSIMKIIS